MIKRAYFFSAQCPYGDGTGSYSFMSSSATFTSWFADPEAVKKKFMDDAKKYFEEHGRTNIQLDVTAFNRI